MKTILIKNAQIVSHEKIKKSDVLIEGSTIKKIESSILINNVQTIDATGLYLLPGIIDPHVHFREPGLTHKEDLESGSKAAVKGGVTSILEMPNTKPSTITHKLIASKKKLAAQKCLTNYNFFIGATESNIEEINECQNIAGIKLFLGSSTGNLLLNDQDSLIQLFEKTNQIIAIHCENEQIIKENSLSFNENSVFSHPKIRSEKAAKKALEQIYEILKHCPKKVHICHVTSNDEVELLKLIKKDFPVTAEACPQHFLTHDLNVYENWGNLAKVNPPIRDRIHQESIKDAIREGIIDCIASDHAPHLLSEKQKPYFQAPSGMPQVELNLPLMLHQVNNDLISLKDIARLMSYNPAKIFSLKNKGEIKESYNADLTLIDLNKTDIIKNNKLFTKPKWSIFDGQKIKGWPIMTMIMGHIVYQNGKIDDSKKGQEIIIQQRRENEN